MVEKVCDFSYVSAVVSEGGPFFLLFPLISPWLVFFCIEFADLDFV